MYSFFLRHRYDPVHSALRKEKIKIFNELLLVNQERDDEEVFNIDKHYSTCGNPNYSP